jgi:hypothetical protein
MDIQSYLNGIAQFVCAIVQWSYESEQYFGKRGLEIEELRALHLLPKETSSSEEIGPLLVNDALL